MKIQWIFYNIALPSSVIVTIVYWGLLYNGWLITFHRFTTHGVNVILMISEQYISSVNTRILHIYQTIIFATAYALFSVILWSTSGTIVYPVIGDWGASPGWATGVTFGIIAMYIIGQFLLFFICHGLEVCAKRYERPHIKTDPRA